MELISVHVWDFTNCEVEVIQKPLSLLVAYMLIKVQILLFMTSIWYITVFFIVFVLMRWIWIL